MSRKFYCPFMLMIPGDKQSPSDFCLEEECALWIKKTIIGNSISSSCDTTVKGHCGLINDAKTFLNE